MTEMDLIIRPYESIGSVKFGMTVEEVRAILGGRFQYFMKSPSSAMPTDAFEEKGIHVYYKEPGLCEAVEVTSPASPVFKGRPLIGRPFDELRNWFEEMDEEIMVDESGLTSLALGIGLYSPYASDSPQEPVEAVIVFEKGYYD